MLDYIKFLGVWIDRDLTWETQVSKLCSKISQKLELLRRGKHLLNVAAKITLYYAQVHSLLTYGLAIWGSMITYGDKKK